MRYLLLVLLLVGCGGGGSSQPQQPPHASPLVIGIIGNSKACGYYQTGWDLLVAGGPNIDANNQMTQAGEDNPNIHGWAQDLGRWVRAKGGTVYNLAGAGWTTQTHIDRQTVQKFANMSPKPSIVFVQLIVNDRLLDSVSISGGITFSQYVENTRQIVSDLQAAGIRPILVKEDNEALTAGAGVPWAEWGGMGGTITGTNDSTHRAYAEYESAYDALGAELKVTVLDAYTPSLNMGQEPRYSYQGILAPSNFRYSLMRGMMGRYNDVWHQNDTGGALILKVYEDFLSPMITNRGD